MLADRLGRRLALMASTLAYSIFTAACGLSRGVLDLAVFRFLLGLGMGGEWATGAALVAETWRAEHRAKALGLMQSGFAIGYALAAVLVPLYARAGAATTPLALGPLVAFSGTGHFTGFDIITSELFPTSFRASAMVLTYNFGGALSAAAPWLMGMLAQRQGLSSAFWMSGLAFLAAALLALGLPKPYGPTLN